jgi:hypothetical protein
VRLKGEGAPISLRPSSSPYRVRRVRIKHAFVLDQTFCSEKLERLEVAEPEVDLEPLSVLVLIVAEPQPRLDQP